MDRIDEAAPATSPAPAVVEAPVVAEVPKEVTPSDVVKPEDTQKEQVAEKNPGVAVCKETSIAPASEEAMKQEVKQPGCEPKTNATPKVDIEVKPGVRPQSVVNKKPSENSQPRRRGRKPKSK